MADTFVSFVSIEAWVPKEQTQGPKIAGTSQTLIKEAFSNIRSTGIKTK